MACVKRRRGKWVVDWYDATGARRWASHTTREAADAKLAEVVKAGGSRSRPEVDPRITVRFYCSRWLDTVKATRKPRTLEAYTSILGSHILPEFRDVRIRDITKSKIKAFLVRKLNEGCARGHVAMIYRVLRTLLFAALDDGVITQNPCARLGRSLNLSQDQQGSEPKAFDRSQLDRFLTAAQQAPRANARASTLYVMWLTGARAGLRIGELIGLRWKNLDFDRREIHVQQQISRGRLGTLKSNKSRLVDMSDGLALALQRHFVLVKTEALKRGSGVPEHVFTSRTGKPFDYARALEAFNKARDRAGLPDHFTPHSLKHTFASQLLSAGESPEYVSRMCGHHSVGFTVRVYGRWLPMSNKGAVNALDAPASPGGVAEMVANGTPSFVTSRNHNAVANIAGQPLGGRR